MKMRFGALIAPIVIGCKSVAKLSLCSGLSPQCNFLTIAVFLSYLAVSRSAAWRLPMN
jgi:hypothetical protein